LKKILKSIPVVVLLAVFLTSIVGTVLAVSTSDAVEKIDMSKSGSLTLTYAVDDKRISGMEIELYLAASISADHVYSMAGAFKSYPVEVNGIKSQTEWDEVRDTIGAYITADKPAPSATGTTGENGVVSFGGLALGIYYVRWTGNETADKVSGFAPFMIAVPGIGEDGKWIYDVDALPKPGKLPEPSSDKMTLVKLWNDGSNSSGRPSSVNVELYCDGVLFKSLELSAENNWSYSWESDDTHVWNAVERNIPEGYTVTVQNRDGKTIQITNSLVTDPTPPPETGDDSNLSLWLILMAASGGALILAGILRRRKNEE